MKQQRRIRGCGDGTRGHTDHHEQAGVGLAHRRVSVDMLHSALVGPMVQASDGDARSGAHHRVLLHGTQLY